MSSPLRKPATTSGGTRSPGSWQCPGGNVRDPGRRASPRGDDRRLVPTSLPTSFTGSFGPHAGRVSDLSRHHRRDGRRSLLDATRCRIVGGEVASPMTVLSPLEVGVRSTTVSRQPDRQGVLPRSGPLRCREGGPTVREAARRAEIGAVPSVGQPGERRHRTPKSVNAVSEAELVVGPGRGALRDVSHREAVTVSSFCGGGTRIQGPAISGGGSVTVLQ